MTLTPLIELESVGCMYYARSRRLRLRKFEALKSVSFTLNQGETLGIVGKNGAGKSTLLRILCRILTPNTGRVRYREGLTVSLLTLHLGFCPELTGRDNAILGALYMGYSRKEAETRMGSIQDFAELGDWFDDPIRSYSTGMLARLGFAVAIEMQPDIILVDEVLGVGDLYFQEKSSAALHRKLSGGQTTVLVSHDEQTMRRLCTRLLWLDDGRIRSEGTADEVFEQYRASMLKE